MESDKPTSFDGTICDHKYTQPDADHHYSEHCDICHDEGGAVSHKYTLTMEKNAQGKIVRYGVECLCGATGSDKIISDDINFFTAPTEMRVDNWWHGSTHGNAHVEGTNIYQVIYLAGNKTTHEG